jgi:hypothetical protein
MLFDLPIDILYKLFNIIPDKDLCRLACVNRLSKEFAGQEREIRKNNLMTRSSNIRIAVLMNKLPLIGKVINSTPNIHDRKSIICETVLLCIHHNNKCILEKLVAMYSLTIQNQMYHILSMIQYPLNDNMFKLVSGFVAHDKSLKNMLDRSQTNADIVYNDDISTIDGLHIL